MANYSTIRNNAFDKNYLSLQFWNKIYRKNWTEFQSFFEDIMQRAYPDFQKIRPYGNQGDRGNDGYRPSEGIYYQVYAPINPNEKEARAAQKLKEDFRRLKTDWDQIAEVKTFYFVFNDKGAGVSIEIEKALSELKKDNQNIDFKKLTPKDLEEIFFTLKNDQILALGFDINLTDALRVAREYLEKLEIELDRENGKIAIRAIENLRDIVASLKDENLTLDYEILECRALQKLENIPKAKEKYESLCTRYPKDPRPFLYLAEFYINNEDFEKNEELLKQAETIDSGYWLLVLEKLIRELRLNHNIDLSCVDERAFPSEPRIKSIFYRLYSLFLEQSGDQTKADSFIERAIYLNPEKFANYDAKLSILEARLPSCSNDREKFKEAIKIYFDNIEAVEQKAGEWGGLNPRNQAVLNFRKITVFHAQENCPKIEKLAKESFELIIQCYLDQLIDKLLVELLMRFGLPTKDFGRVLHYLQGAEKAISDDLAKALVFQFNLKETLFTEGRKFFEDMKKKSILGFINKLEDKKYDEVCTFLRGDTRFAIAMANSAKESPGLRKKIIENLPNDRGIQKEKLLFLLNYDEKNIDEVNCL